MLLRERLEDEPSRRFISVGMSCLSLGFLMFAAGCHWFETKPLLAGFLLGLAGVLIGLSIVVNIQGLKRYRTEQAGR